MRERDEATKHYLGKKMQILVVHKLTYVCNVMPLMLWKKEIESKDHTGMYKKEGSLQSALVVGLIKTVHLKKTSFIEEQP